jgi:hypothetical protein
MRVLIERRGWGRIMKETGKNHSPKPTIDREVFNEKLK